jgi:thioesterase domain-containing protein/acyl carrier protein
VAIQYAQFVGAEVFATAGSEEKHEFLRSLGVKHIASSRDGSRFEQDMKGFLDKAGYDGIDVVLNSLSHDDYIPRSLALLRKGGRFMEIGKRNVWSHERMREERPDVSYEKIEADTMMEKESWKYNGYLRRLLQRVEDGGLKPINLHIFDGLEKGVDAMKFLQRAQNIGKVIITEPSKVVCKPQDAMLLSGGLGALGLVLSQFLVEEGCKSVCLTSRSGKPAGEVQAQWQWLCSSMAEVAAKSCDVGNEDAVRSLASGLPRRIAGLWHLAGVLADGMIPTLTEECFQKSYAPKVHGLYNLCKYLSFEEHASLVLFSSTSSLFGSPGQANYSAANSVLDSLAPYWSAVNKYRARSAQWGPWAEVGMAVQKGTVQRAKASGLGALTSAQGMSIVGSILAGGEPLVGAAHVRWPKFLRTVYASGPPAFLHDLEVEARRTAAASGTKGDAVDISLTLAGLTPEERLARVHEVILRVSREVVDNDELAADVALLESGMDSLSGVEFRNRLLNEFGGIRIPNSAVFDYPTVSALAEFVSSQIDGTSAGASPIPNGGDAASAVPDEERRAEQIFEQLNDRAASNQQSWPLFLVPGAGMQSGGFRALASLLPLPVYGASWPRGLRPRAEWPATLGELAELLLSEARALLPAGVPLLLAGHSFGATVCREMARQYGQAGGTVAFVALLDPRSLPPVQTDLLAASKSGGLAGTIALLTALVGDDAASVRYAELFEKVSRLPESEQDAMVESTLGGAAAASLQHVRETSQWYAELLGSAGANATAAKSNAKRKGGLIQRKDDAGAIGKVATKEVLLHAAETWRETETASAAQPDVPASAAATIRRFQASIFQEDAEVSARVPEATSVFVPGDHFSMLHEPHVATLALRLCHGLVEAGAGAEVEA